MLRTRLWLALGVVLASLWMLAGAQRADSAAIPGYRLETVWPASSHGLPNPGNLTRGPGDAIWFLDGPAGEAVAVGPDGVQDERRPVPADALDLAAEPGGDLYLGRWAGKPRLHSTVGRYLADGSEAWTREDPSATGTGVASTAGRIWYTAPERGALVWFGRADGRVSGEVAPRGASPGFPADVDVAPDGTLFATDLIGDAVYAWPPPYLPNDFSRWTMNESSGPFRIGVGAQDDGELLVAILFSGGLVRVHRPDGDLVARFFVPGEPADLAMGEDGRIYVLDDLSHEVRVYAPGPPPTATPAPADPPPSPKSCTIQGTRQVLPPGISRCETAQVVIQLDADCPPGAVSGADILLIIDDSISMTIDKRLDAARSAAKRFLNGLDFQYHRVGVVAFSNEARVAQPLTTDRAGLDAALDGLTPMSTGSTNIAAAIQEAAAHLQAEGRQDALPVIILLTDGVPTRPMAPEPGTAAQVAAERARTRRTYIVTVGLGKTIDSLLMGAIASSPKDFYYSPSVLDLDRIYEKILDVVQGISLTDLVIRDTPSQPFVRYVDGSGQPPPLVVGDTLQWTRPVLPEEGLVFTYTLKAQLPGRAGIGKAFVRYLDADGTQRQFDFDEPVLNAVLPTAVPGTPQPTPTPDPSGPTPLPTLPPAPPPEVCPSPWSLKIVSFADMVGAGGYDCPGCNGLFDGGDFFGSSGEPATVVVSDGSGRTLWVGQLSETPGGGPPSAHLKLCAEPPYTVRLAGLPGGYVSCPNSPAEQRIGTRRFGLDRQATVRFVYWSGCGMDAPTPRPFESPTPLPPCP